MPLSPGADPRRPSSRAESRLFRRYGIVGVGGPPGDFVRDSVPERSTPLGRRFGLVLTLIESVGFAGGAVVAVGTSTTMAGASVGAGASGAEAAGCTDSRCSSTVCSFSFSAFSFSFCSMYIWCRDRRRSCDAARTELGRAALEASATAAVSETSLAPSATTRRPGVAVLRKCLS